MSRLKFVCFRCKKLYTETSFISTKRHENCQICNNCMSIFETIINSFIENEAIMIKKNSDKDGFGLRVC